MKKAVVLLAAIGVANALTSCTTGDGNSQAAAKTFDTICTTEPPLFAAYMTVAVANGASESRLKKAEGIHASITTICESRPSNVLAAVVTLTAAYAQFLAITRDEHKRRLVAER